MSPAILMECRLCVRLCSVHTADRGSQALLPAGDRRVSVRGDEWWVVREAGNVDGVWAAAMFREAGSVDGEMGTEIRRSR